MTDSVGVWLQCSFSFALDPDLSLGEGAYYPNPELANFRIFDDSAPDRWGQMLMRLSFSEDDCSSSEEDFSG